MFSITPEQYHAIHTCFVDIAIIKESSFHLHYYPWIYVTIKITKF